MCLQFVCTCTINITRLTFILDPLVWKPIVIVMVNNLVYVLHLHIQGKWSLTKYKTVFCLSRFCKFKFGHGSNWIITLIGLWHAMPLKELATLSCNEIRSSKIAWFSSWQFSIKKKGSFHLWFSKVPWTFNYLNFWPLVHKWVYTWIVGGLFLF